MRRSSVNAVSLVSLLGVTDCRMYVIVSHYITPAVGTCWEVSLHSKSRIESLTIVIGGE